MEQIEAFLQSASIFGVIHKLAGLSSTDIAVLFLASKPAFILTAGVVVFTSHRKRREALPEADGVDDDPHAGLLADE